MQPFYWCPSVTLSAQEEQIAGRIRRAKLFVFLRHHRHELFDEAFQQELATLYRPSKRGHPPVAPAQLALAVILQVYTGVSDDEVIEATFMDRRWQVVLDCLDADQPPWNLGTFVAFRKRLIDAETGPTTSRTDDWAGPPHPGIWIARLACSAGQQSVVGSRPYRGLLQPHLPRPQKGAPYSSGPAGASIDRGCPRGRSRVGLRTEPESSTRLRLGSAWATRRSAQSRLAGTAGCRNLGANAPTGRAGWSPKYIPEAVLREAATRLQDRFLFGSDYPFITPQRWMRDFEAVKIEFKPEVKEKLFWRNGQKLLGHTAVGQMHFSS